MPFMITWPFAEDPVADGLCDAVPEDWRTSTKPASGKLAAPKRGCATEMLDPLRSIRTAIPCRTRHAVRKSAIGLSVSFPEKTATAWRDPDGPEAEALHPPTPTSIQHSARWGSTHFRQR